MRPGRKTTRLMLVALVLLGLGGQAQAQFGYPFGTMEYQSSVSFIDSAIPMSQFRLRWDHATNLNRPNRAEYFWAGPEFAGRPFPERSVDYQELQSYLEIGFAECASVFFEAPVRFLNPEVNSNTAGAGDLNAGGKLVFWETPVGLISGQFRVYIPTGLAERGLGTEHVSLEPAILFNRKVHDWVTLEGEVRYWTAVNGTSFSGDMIRYGLGVTFGQQSDCGPWATPVVEFVGWTPLSGREQYLSDAGVVVTEESRGHSIVNAMFGLRAGLGCCVDAYAGYGFRLSGDQWYEETLRVELRLKF